MQQVADVRFAKGVGGEVVDEGVGFEEGFGDDGVVWEGGVEGEEGGALPASVYADCGFLD